MQSPSLVSPAPHRPACSPAVGGGGERHSKRSLGCCCSNLDLCTLGLACGDRPRFPARRLVSPTSRAGACLLADCLLPPPPLPLTSDTVRQVFLLRGPGHGRWPLSRTPLTETLKRCCCSGSHICCPGFVNLPPTVKRAWPCPRTPQAAAVSCFCSHGKQSCVQRTGGGHTPMEPCVGPTTSPQTKWCPHLPAPSLGGASREAPEASRFSFLCFINRKCGNSGL